MEGVPKKELSLFDSTCIIVGIIIGAGIYETAPIVAKCFGSGPGLMLVWLAGGLLALTGALCYAELATAYPREGGDYVYLTRAYGRWPGYMFGWSQLAIVRPGDIALMAFIFARYAQTLYAPFEHSGLFYAASAIVVLTVINILGVKAGKWTQNLLTVTKILGLVAISVVGLRPLPRAPAPRIWGLYLGWAAIGLYLGVFHLWWLERNGLRGRRDQAATPKYRPRLGGGDRSGHRPLSADQWRFPLRPGAIWLVFLPSGGR